MQELMIHEEEQKLQVAFKDLLKLLHPVKCFG